MGWLERCGHAVGILLFAICSVACDYVPPPVVACPVRNVVDDEGDVVGSSVGLYAPPGTFGAASVEVLFAGEVVAESIAGPDGSLVSDVRVEDVDLDGRVLVVRSRGVEYRVVPRRQTGGNVVPDTPGVFVEASSDEVRFGGRIDPRGSDTAQLHRVLLVNRSTRAVAVIVSPSPPTLEQWFEATIAGREGDKMALVAQHRDGLGTCVGSPCGCRPERAAMGLCRENPLVACPVREQMTPDGATVTHTVELFAAPGAFAPGTSLEVSIGERTLATVEAGADGSVVAMVTDDALAHPGVLSVDDGLSPLLVGFSEEDEGIVVPARPADPIEERHPGTLYFLGDLVESPPGPTSDVAQLLFVNHTSGRAEVQGDPPSLGQRFTAVVPGNDSDDVVLVARHESGRTTCFRETDAEPVDPGEPI